MDVINELKAARFAKGLKIEGEIAGNPVSFLFGMPSGNVMEAIHEDHETELEGVTSESKKERLKNNNNLRILVACLHDENMEPAFQSKEATTEMIYFIVRNKPFGDKCFALFNELFKQVNDPLEDTAAK